MEWAPGAHSQLRVKQANRSGATVRPLYFEHLEGTRAPIVGRGGCSVGSSRLRAPVQSLASIARSGLRWDGEDLMDMIEWFVGVDWESENH